MEEKCLLPPSSSQPILPPLVHFGLLDLEDAQRVSVTLGCRTFQHVSHIPWQESCTLESKGLWRRIPPPHLLKGNGLEKLTGKTNPPNPALYLSDSLATLMEQFEMNTF